MRYSSPNGARAADDDCVPLLISSEGYEQCEGESLPTEFPSATGELPERTETRPSSISNVLIANDLLISPQAENGHGMSSTLGSQSGFRPALTSREAKYKSWIKTVCRKLRSYVIARVKSSRDVSKPTHGDVSKPTHGDVYEPTHGDVYEPTHGDVSEPTQGDGHEVGTIWRQDDNQSFPTTILPDPGSKYNVIDLTTAHLIAPGGFDKVPKGSGGRFLDGSFLGFLGSVRALWHVGNTHFPPKVIESVFMVAERAIEFNLVIGRDEMIRHNIGPMRHGGIFSFRSRPDAIDPSTSASFIQDFNHDLAQENAKKAKERWEISRDSHAEKEATERRSDFEQKYKDSNKTTPSADILKTAYRRFYSEAQAAYAQTHPPPSS